MHTGIDHSVVAGGIGPADGAGVADVLARSTSVAASSTSGTAMDSIRNAWHVVTDPISQAIASAPLWIQAPVVIVLAMLGCGVFALVWLRIVDLTGAMAIRIGHRLRSKVDADYQPPRNLAEQRK